MNFAEPMINSTPLVLKFARCISTRPAIILSPAIAHFGHIDPETILGNSELFASVEIRSNLSAVNDVLAWKTGNVRTRSADVFSLDTRNAIPLLGKRPGNVFGSFTGAKNHNVVFRRC
jgi:hypothetical protein